MNVGTESFLDNLFVASAKKKDVQQRGKTFRYELRRKYAGVPEESGECVVLSRRYDRSLDCDVLSCKDIKTNKTFYCNQFQIDLEECI